MSLRILCGLGVCVGLLACSPESSLIGEPVPNSAPDTQVTGTPPVLAETTAEVSFFWNGSDPDGEVVAFEWKITNNGEDAVLDLSDELAVPWTRTEATEGTFEVTAEIPDFPRDAANPNLEDGDYRYWQTHTFLVRAVDDSGEIDPTPARVSFTATTLAPKAWITRPTFSSNITCGTAPVVMTLGWEGLDPDTLDEQPAFARYLVKEIPGECITRDEFRNGNYITGDDPNWSDWIPYDAPEEAGRRVVLPRREPGARYLFAVQVMDRAGAVTPTFEWGRNVRHFDPTAGLWPNLSVTEDFLGVRAFESVNTIATFKLPSGQPLNFTWEADASRYSGEVEAYRYGFDIVDPDNPNDPGWAVAWGAGPAWRKAPTRVFAQGTHNFFVLTRDNSGTVTRAQYQFQIIEVPPFPSRRPLLVVEDWHRDLDSGVPDVFEQVWDRTWEEMLRGAIPGFQSADFIDAQEEFSQLTFETVVDYRNVIWAVSGNDKSFFHSQLVSAGTDAKFNWLEAFQANAGNVLLMGPRATTATTNVSLDVGFPLIYNSDMFGEDERPDGTRYNVGTTFYPYRAFCIETTGVVRPQRIAGEPAGAIFRNERCDGLAGANVTDAFRERFPGAFEVVDLRPNRERLDLNRAYGTLDDEFYNRNFSNREASLQLRDCQTPMFEAETRLGAAIADNPENCPRRTESGGSQLDGAPIAIVSRAYSDRKPLRGAEDFLWGFHPFAWEQADLESALFWVLDQRWEIPVRR